MRTQFSKLTLTASFLLAITFTFSCSSPDDDNGGTSGTFTDNRDNKSYKWVKIGTQIWMAENLNHAIEGSKCYDNENANCAIFGRLYNWVMAMMQCPSGWHLPTNAEWDKLLRYVDDNSGTSSPYSSTTAGKYLKATSRWDSNGNGTDTYGFAGLPGGGGYSNDQFNYVGSHGDWWSAPEIDAGNAYTRFMYNDQDIFGYFKNNESYLFSVRCVKD